jgi:DNA-binding CsgD family transcriptional regulator
VSSQQLEDVLSELRRIVRLMTLSITKELSQRERIALLSAAGFQPKEIAELVGTTANTVSVTLAHIRKQQGVRRSAAARRGGGTS